MFSIQLSRNIKITLNNNLYAEGSCLIETGNTKVICTASIDNTTPSFLKGTNSGWLTAEYSMLPRATHTRNQRTSNKPSGRNIEIQRLIGRSLRAAVDLNKLGEKKITIDCDVIQADGGTRTASITGGYVALAIALKNLENKGIIPANTLSNTIAAVSVGIVDDKIISDLNYEQDSSAQTDMNLVMNQNNEWIEIQGTAEKGSFSQDQLLQMLETGKQHIQALIKLQHEIISTL